ncbi:hypothetical protein SeLEV6574_g04435 [Synchytrium endobioticum]|uniref:Uncharacterized protein n=1 Tax=Synchytrium endobioticum TaxID=286115 RepID=A0A507CZG3_9FUNG|nr:hypothetical protein SeLEV6574_g04435 [Synchytrium endobioticum]
MATAIVGCDLLMNIWTATSADSDLLAFQLQHLYRHFGQYDVCSTNAPRCNHRKKRQDFRSHEGGFPVSAAHKKTLYCYEDDGAGWPSHATSFCPDAQLVPSTVWRLKTDTSPALFVHPVGGVQDVQPQPRVVVHRDRSSRQHMNANFYSYCLTRGVVQEYMLPPWLHAAWTAVPPDEW